MVRFFSSSKILFFQQEIILLRVFPHPRLFSLSSARSPLVEILLLQRFFSSAKRISLKNQKSKFEHIFPNPNTKTFLLLKNHRSKATAFAPRLYCFGKMWSATEHLPKGKHSVVQRLSKVRSTAEHKKLTVQQRFIVLVLLCFAVLRNA